MNPTEMLLLPLVRRQHGSVSVPQALHAGASPQQLPTLLGRGWTHPVRGARIEPHPKDPFLVGLHAALLVCPDAVACRASAARLHELWGLPLWTPAELPQVIVPAGRKKAQRRGMRINSGLHAGQSTTRKRTPVTTLAITVCDSPGTTSPIVLAGW